MGKSSHILLYITARPDPRSLSQFLPRAAHLLSAAVGTPSSEASHHPAAGSIKGKASMPLSKHNVKNTHISSFTLQQGLAPDSSPSLSPQTVASLHQAAISIKGKTSMPLSKHNVKKTHISSFTLQRGLAHDSSPSRRCLSNKHIIE